LFFQFDISSRILLYGAASIGAIFHDILVSHGYIIEGFMDFRAFELHEFRNLPVWYPENVPGSKNAYLVIISVKNVFEHNIIAKNLTSKGFHNIIYRPLSVLRGYGSFEDIQLNNIFSRIENNDLSGTPINLPITEKVSGHIFRDRAIIREEGEKLIAHVPVEIIYTNIDQNDNKSIWCNISVSDLKPHLALYEYASGEGGYPQAYIDFCIEAAKSQSGINITDAWIQNILRNRCMIYDEMCLSFELDTDFFKRNPPEVKLNEKGYFNLCGGKHRASFFAFRKMRLMPVRLNKKDYELWLNRPILDLILPMMSEMNYWYESIPHPYFYDFPVIRQSEKNQELANLINLLLRR
jgi:hypothetical protein